VTGFSLANDGDGIHLYRCTIRLNHHEVVNGPADNIPTTTQFIKIHSHKINSDAEIFKAQMIVSYKVKC